MWFYRDTGNIAVDSLVKLFQENNDWDNQYTKMRNNAFEVHTDTAVIPVMWSMQNLLSSPPEVAPKTEFYNKYYVEQFFNELSEKLVQRYGDGYFVRIVFALLKAGGKIHPHSDAGPSLEINKRVHVPIITDKGVIFKVGDEEKHMPASFMYEINTTFVHSVQNDSGVDRVHLIVDWHVKKSH